jgi:hypothetical protein
MGGQVERTEKWKMHTEFGPESHAKCPRGRPRYRLEDVIKMGIREIRVSFEVVEWIQLARGRVQRQDFVNTVMNLRVC